MIRAWLLRRIGVLPPSPPVAAAATTSIPDSLDPAGVEAFVDQMRWVMAFEDKRAETFGQRAATILGFDGVIMSVLVAGLALIKKDVHFTAPFVANAVAVVLLPILSALACLTVLHPRKVTVPESVKLRGQWAAFIEPGSKVHPAAQIAHSFLGGDKDPMDAASREATSRGEAYKTALYLLTAAVIGLGALISQALAQ